MSEDRCRFVKGRLRFAPRSGEPLPSAAHARFPEPAESFVVGPPGCPIARKRQTILWQVDGGGHEVTDRCEASLTQHVV